MKNTMRFMVAVLTLSAVTLSALAADYTQYLTTARGFTEVVGGDLQSPSDAIWGDADYCYILAPDESRELIVGVGSYEAKPGWASEDSKALRYHSAETDPVLDLTNFFTIEKSGSYIGLRNLVYNTDLFQTHDGAGYMYVNTYTDPTLDEWSYLIPHWQNDGYWLFENCKYPASNTEGWRGYMGSWTPGRMAVDEPIALNRLNTDGDPAGHYRLFRISRTDLMALRLYATVLTSANGFTEVTSTDDMSTDPSQVYLITSAEQPGLFVGVGRYEAKPDWAGEDTKALRYRQAGNPVLDLSNFFTIEKDGDYIGMRNVVYHTSLFQTHDNAGFMYVLTYTEPNMSDWCYLKPTWHPSTLNSQPSTQEGYWLFENGKYPASSDAWARGYMGPWNNRVEANEPIALNRRNTEGDEAGHYRLWRISRANLFTLMQLPSLQGEGQGWGPADMTYKISNPSFEQGETGWTLTGKDANGNDEFTARDYGMTGKAGGMLMNAYQWWASSLSVTQTVTNLPAGQYELSGIMASWKDRPLTFEANASKTTAVGVHADGGIKVKASVTIGSDGQLTITAGSTTDWWTEGVTHGDDDNKTFFKLDDVQLHCTSLALDALAVRLPNNETKLVPGQWYYYETDYSTEYQLVGPLNGLVYTTDGTVLVSGGFPAGTAATRTMTLPVGRTYFKTSAENATLIIMPYRNVEEGTFTAVALNVDGLPNKIATFDLNPDGPGRDGTLKISQYLASKGYDFIGCSEDFNYNGALMESLDGYSCGTIRNTLSVGDIDYWQLIQGKIHVDTDGLNLLWKNSKISTTGESWTKWNDTESTDGNQYVNKGYRYYNVTIDGRVSIDVFILHMDAGDTNATWSRESQWRQLADAINNSDNTRAKLIIGDTNSRYTREDVISNFINRLSNDFTMSDVWVEFYRNGIYPTTDMDNLTDQSNPTNYSNYEIVDKIIYINPRAANTVQLVPQSFRIEQDYTYGYVNELNGGANDDNTPLGDHRPVVVTFKYLMSGDVVPTDITLTDASDNATAISNADGVLANVTLQGRTLHKDGSWNTLCLPFNMTAEQVRDQLGPSALMELDTDNYWAMVDGQWSISNNGNNGHKTGTDGPLLYLNFKDAEAITAGTPYIIKWASGDNIVSPTFRSVTVSGSNSATAVSSTDGTVTFQGTYTPVTLANGDKRNLFLGAENKLYWPNADDFIVNAFRAYFKLSNPATARQIVLNFDDGNATGIEEIEDERLKIENAVYDLMGRRIESSIFNSQSSIKKKGMYIKNGQKIIVK